ncbi:MAG: head GIN domain-containing protein [Archangium sp.]|nr:head GIN domain-containing protein [Archangium sp.]
MRALPLLGLLAVVLSTTAVAGVRGSGIKFTETRKIADFSEIEVSDGVNLEVKAGPTSLTIEGDDNIVPLYGTEVVGGTLRVHRKTKERVSTDRELIVRVTTPSLKHLSASGGVHASLVDVVGKTFVAELSGGVELNAPRLAVDSLALDASGGVNVVMSGRAQAAKFNLSGGVEVKAKGLEVAAASVDASGGCQVDVTVKDSVTGEISGGVGLTVHGNPPKSRVRTGGGADVEYVD